MRPHPVTETSRIWRGWLLSDDDQAPSPSDHVPDDQAKESDGQRYGAQELHLGNHEDE